MYIKELYIKSLGRTDNFHAELYRGVNTISSRYADEIAYAIGLISNRRVPMPPHPPWRRESEITAHVSADGKEYTVTVMGETAELCARDEAGADVGGEYRYITAHTAEQDESEIYIADQSAALIRMIRHLYTAESRRGGYIGCATFRSYAKQYLKSYVPELIRKGKQYRIIIDRDGSFKAVCEDGEGAPLLSECEARLFQYLCFLRTAEFWHGFEQVRNLHTVKKPLIINGLIERMDEEVDLSEIYERTAALGRQAIFITTKK